jgi:hypothetical protein
MELRLGLEPAPPRPRQRGRGGEMLSQAARSAGGVDGVGRGRLPERWSARRTPMAVYMPSSLGAVPSTSRRRPARSFTQARFEFVQVEAGAYGGDLDGGPFGGEGAVDGVQQPIRRNVGVPGCVREARP